MKLKTILSKNAEFQNSHSINRALNHSNSSSANKEATQIQHDFLKKATMKNTKPFQFRHVFNTKATLF
jgi:hypothetical protein